MQVEKVKPPTEDGDASKVSTSGAERSSSRSEPRRNDSASTPGKERDRIHVKRPARRSRSPSDKRRRSKSRERSLSDGEVADDTLKVEEEAPKKKEPLSLEELLAKRRAEAEAASKPTFLTKEQRAELALKKRQEEAAAIRAKQEEERKKREAFMKEAKEQAEKELREKERGRDRGRDRERDRRRRSRSRERRRSRSRDRTDAEKMPPPSSGNNDETPQTKEEQEAVKARYLGEARKKKKVRRLHERKFVFDWDQSEAFAQSLKGGTVKRKNEHSKKVPMLTGDNSDQKKYRKGSAPTPILDNGERFQNKQ